MISEAENVIALWWCLLGMATKTLDESFQNLTEEQSNKVLKLSGGKKHKESAKWFCDNWHKLNDLLWTDWQLRNWKIIVRNWKALKGFIKIVY